MSAYTEALERIVILGTRWAHLRVSLEGETAPREELAAAERDYFADWLGAYAEARRLSAGEDVLAWAAYDQVMMNDARRHEALVRSAVDGSLPLERATALAAIDAFAAAKERSLRVEPDLRV
jgi:hypothetical protein